MVCTRGTYSIRISSSITRRIETHHTPGHLPIFESRVLPNSLTLHVTAASSFPFPIYYCQRSPVATRDIGIGIGTCAFDGVRPDSWELSGYRPVSLVFHPCPNHRYSTRILHAALRCTDHLQQSPLAATCPATYDLSYYDIDYGGASPYNVQSLRRQPGHRMWQKIHRPGVWTNQNAATSERAERV